MKRWHERWRRFRPRKQPTPAVITHGNYHGVIADAWRLVDDITRDYDVRAHDGIDQLDRSIDSRKTTASTAAEWVALVLLQTPRAARAQAQMDLHKHNYHNHHERLFELIDFNDSFVNSVLTLPKSELATYEKTLREASSELCRRLHAPNFTDEQYEAIVRGLSREIAVYRGAVELGYTARMTSRQEDAFGIDMVIDDAEGRSVNVDVKTPSAFRHRMDDLEKEDRITEQQLLEADEQDFLVHIHKHQGSHAEYIPVVLLCIRRETVGDIVDFEFTDPAQLGGLIDRAMNAVETTTV